MGIWQGLKGPPNSTWTTCSAALGKSVRVDIPRGPGGWYALGPQSMLASIVQVMIWAAAGMVKDTHFQICLH
jgi:hypothetical protein